MWNDCSMNVSLTSKQLKLQAVKVLDYESNVDGRE